MFNQLFVMPGCIVDGVEELHSLFAEQGFRVQFEAQFETLAGQGGEGGRNDALVYIHADDVGKFALWRLQYGMSWWEDYVVNNDSIIPERIKAKYTSRWETA